LGHNGETEEVKVVMTRDERLAWREAMQQALGNLNAAPAVDDHEDA
jgi:hypothetical protein